MTRRRPRRRVAIPRRLSLRGRRWKVSLTRRWDRLRPVIGDLKNLRGFCDPESRTIYLDATVSRLVREQTYVHELLHALIPPGLVDGETEERLVLSLEEGLHDAVASGVLSATVDEVE